MSMNEKYNKENRDLPDISISIIILTSALSSVFLILMITGLSTYLIRLITGATLILTLPLTFHFGRLRKAIEKKFDYCIISPIITAVLIIPGFYFQFKFYEFFGSCVPGALFEKGEYTNWLYVNAYPDGEKTLNYRLPALIEAGKEEVSDGENYSAATFYSIRKLMLPDGTLNRMDYVDDQLGLISAKDETGRKWNVEILSQELTLDERSSKGLSEITVKRRR
jgi:hypothetical protein